MNKLSAYMMLAAAMMENSMERSIRRRPDELNGIDIEREYHLIQQKKSRLSKRLRDRVIYLYNKES